jgi:hypothetical protein
MRKKGTGYRLQVTVVLLLGFLFTVHCTLYPILAAKPTPSPTPSPTPDPVQQKLNDLQTDSASKAAEIKSEVSQKIQNKAYIGQIVRTDSAKNIFLSTTKGDRQVSVDEYTVYQDNLVARPVRGNITFSALRANDTVVALGDVDDKNILHAKRIIRIKALPENTDVAIWGKISSVFPSSIDITDRNNQKVNLSLTGNTLVRFSNNEDATLTNIKPGGLLLSVGSAVAKQKSNSNFVYLFDSVQHSPTASPSAKLATPSASVKSK